MFFTSACTSLKKLNQMDISSSNLFNEELAKLYKSFAEDEARNYDWGSSAYFAKKAIRALNGGNVDPEPLEGWRISESEEHDFIWARKRLNKALSANVKKGLPYRAANAQFMFDCWLEEHSEEWRHNNINQCRTDFLLEMALLEGKIEPALYQVRKVVTNVAFDSDPEPKIPDFVFIEDYNVFFDFAESGISDRADIILTNVAKKASELEQYAVKIDGHSDKMGSKNLNMILSEKRALAVTEHLIDKGVKPEFIETNWHGESSPRFDTEDGVAQKLNRRVEIIIKGNK